MPVVQLISVTGLPVPTGTPSPALIGLSTASLFMDLVAIIAISFLVYVIRSRAKIAAREKMAREDALHLQSIVDAVPVPLFYKDLEGRYIGCNRAFEEVLGKERGEIVGRTVYDVAPSDLATIYHKADLDLIASQGKQVYETKVLFGDGIRHDILFHKAVFRDRAGGVCGMVGSMLDISELKRTERHLVQSEDRYRAFIAMSTEGIWRGDISPPVSVNAPIDDQVASFVENLHIAECNDALASIYGYSCAAEIVGRRTREFYDLEQVHEVLERFVDSGYSLHDYETRQYDRYGREIWLSSTLVGVVEDGKVSRLWGTRRDITERKRQHVALEYNANHDSLTGLPNRFYLKNRLEAELAMLDDHGQLALFILDLDRFKEVNDTLGHHAGDLLLIELAKRLQQVLTGLGGDIARLGGGRVRHTLYQGEKRAGCLLACGADPAHHEFPLRHRGDQGGDRGEPRHLHCPSPRQVDLQPAPLRRCGHVPGKKGHKALLSLLHRARSLYPGAAGPDERSGPGGKGQ